MEGKVYIIVGVPGCGKSTLRRMLLDNKHKNFWTQNGFLIQDISPDGEGSWIFGKNKDEIRRLKQEFKNGFEKGYSPSYYKEVVNTLTNLKKYLRLFIGDVGGMPLDDKTGIINAADGIIYLRQSQDWNEWDRSLPANKPVLKFELPAEKICKADFETILYEIVEKLYGYFNNEITEPEEEYDIQIEEFIAGSGYNPVSITKKFNKSRISKEDLARCRPLSPGKKYCLYGRGPVFAYAHLAKNLDHCAVFDPKLADPIVDLPVLVRENDKNTVKYEIIQSAGFVKLEFIINERFIRPFDLPLIEVPSGLKEPVLIGSRASVWAQLDAFLQLKKTGMKRGLVNYREQEEIWLD